LTFKQKSVTHMDHAFFHRVLLNSDATQTPKAHMVVGVIVMMDRKTLNVHGTVPIFWWDNGGIIPSGMGVVNQIWTAEYNAKV
jgi:hypothetical protein